MTENVELYELAIPVEQLQARKLKTLDALNLQKIVALAYDNVRKAKYLFMLGLAHLVFGLSYPLLLTYSVNHHLIERKEEVLTLSAKLLVVVLFSGMGSYLMIQSARLGSDMRRQIQRFNIRHKGMNGTDYATARR
jgi:uncharacterized membrane protein YeiB